MDIALATSGLGVSVRGFDHTRATDADIELLTKHIYEDKVIALKDQQVDAGGLVELGKRFGELVRYYEPMYHHPEHPDVFVSSNVPKDGKQVGVPRTGKFWHADYQFKPQPFAFTIFAPQILPSKNRGTFFINMAQAYEQLPEQLREEISGLSARHSVSRYFKVRPSDVYRPLGEIIDEVNASTPAVEFPVAFEHPVTGEKLLYFSEGFTVDIPGSRPGLLRELLQATGQLDTEFSHPLIHTHAYDPGDIVIWDNRTLIHRALHTSDPTAATVSHRVTALDGYPLYSRAL